MRRIGVLSLNKAASDAAQYEVAAFRAALRSAGYLHVALVGLEAEKLQP